MKVPLLRNETAAPVLPELEIVPEACCRKVPLLVIWAPLTRTMLLSVPLRVAVVPVGLSRVLPLMVKVLNAGLSVVPPLAVRLPAPLRVPPERVVVPLTVMSLVPVSVPPVIVRVVAAIGLAWAWCSCS